MGSYVPYDKNRVFGGSGPVEPEYNIKELRDGTMVEIIPKSEFWTSVAIVIISLVAIPYLYYCLFSFYDKIDLDTLTSDDKSLYEKLWIGSIIFVVLLSISVIIFISFYFKNFNKRAFAQDNVSIRDAFKLISREIAQHAADEYSDDKVDAHMEDMSTLGGRIVASQRGDKWYSDPSEFRQNYQQYTSNPATGAKRYYDIRKQNQSQATEEVPVTVRPAINTPAPAPAPEPVAVPVPALPAPAPAPQALPAPAPVPTLPAPQQQLAIGYYPQAEIKAVDVD